MEHFYDMYDSIENELIEAKVMTILEELEWQDKDGNRVEFEPEAYGCKVTSKIYRLDIVIIVDEVGGNLDMTGNGYLGGEKLICDNCCIAQRKATESEKFHSYWY